MKNFQLSKIYKLVSDETADVYIGSTTKRYLCQRMASHKIDFQNWKKGKQHYITSYELIKDPSCKIELLENYPCANIDELRKRERYWIDNSENVVNKIVPTRTNKEYQQLPKAKQYKKEWEATNKLKVKVSKEKRKDKLHEWQKSIAECDCGSIYSKSNKAQHIKTKKHQAWETNLIIPMWMH